MVTSRSYRSKCVFQCRVGASCCSIVDWEESDVLFWRGSQQTSDANDVQTLIQKSTTTKFKVLEAELMSQVLSDDEEPG